MILLRRLAVWLVLATTAAAAYGDGGSILLHHEAGPFIVTLFGAPQPLQTGAADISVMVQDRGSGDVLLDPDVELTMAKRGAAEQTVRLVRGEASNRLMLAARVRFPQPGDWQATLLIVRGRDRAQLSTELMVKPESSRARLVWFYILLPVGIILLFVLHQTLKLRQEAR